MCLSKRNASKQLKTLIGEYVLIVCFDTKRNIVGSTKTTFTKELCDYYINKLNDGIIKTKTIQHLVSNNFSRYDITFQTKKLMEVK